MKIAITGIRDGLVLIGWALLVCLLIVGTFALADEYHIKTVWAFFALNSFAMIPLFLRAFRGHLKRPFMIPFLVGLAIVHGLVFIGLLKYRIPFIYWFPVFIVELSIGAWASYRFFRVIPSGDI